MIFSRAQIVRKRTFKETATSTGMIDGTALGILGVLPNFIRNIELVSSVPRMPGKKYLMREPKLRASVDSVLVEAK